MSAQVVNGEKLLIANRGEIAVRILRTARRLKIPTVAIYTRCDAASLHTRMADEAVPLRAKDTDLASNARGYLDIEEIVKICVEKSVTMVHPGYGFLSENADFAAALVEKGISWVGPRSELIRMMGLKHEARQLAQRAGVPVIPSSGVVVPRSLDEALFIAAGIGYPVMVKAAAGGGGMGMVVCMTEQELKDRFDSVTQRAQSLFHNDSVLVERYFPAARHIEVQIFGNGQGHVVHMGERECSIQRRFQKVIEESPSPFMVKHQEIRNQMCQAAIDLCSSVSYNSAGTIEFLVDDVTGDYYFLEVNTRIQVEHTVTEALCPDLDLVKLMILQAITEKHGDTEGLPSEHLEAISQHFSQPIFNKWAIQARVYCENPSANFTPAPGTLQHVAFLEPLPEWLRVDTWIETGTEVTPFYDPLVAKVVVSATSREQAIFHLSTALGSCQVLGPPNNIAYLRAILENEIFAQGEAKTQFLSQLTYTPQAMDVLDGGLETTIQDLWRRHGPGIPHSGPMDSLALSVANLLIGNAQETEGLEITLPTVTTQFYFHIQALVCICGAQTQVQVNGQHVDMWSRILIPAKATLKIGGPGSGLVNGFRVYLAIKGGFPKVPQYLQSKSTSMGFGGYQGRSLASGDQLVLADYSQSPYQSPLSLPIPLVPPYPEDQWNIYCLSGPHCDSEFVTFPGIQEFFAATWRVSMSSNRMGIRLEGPQIQWARLGGGEGGSHPSNIHDNGYALGTINLNGDTPVILANEGPDMGGYLCIATIATAELWKLGQLKPGAAIKFRRISFNNAQKLQTAKLAYLQDISHFILQPQRKDLRYEDILLEDTEQDPKLSILQRSNQPSTIFRQAGDSAILVEFGPPKLDLPTRAHIHAFEKNIHSSQIAGLHALSSCIRSIMVYFDPAIITQQSLLHKLISIAENTSVHDAIFESRRITFPIVLDDQWNKEAIEQYMRSTRSKAVYLPSNVDYLARNNGLQDAEEALRCLVASDWIVLGVGFYLGCPFMIPIDPRCRLVAQKMNPSRTFTPCGAIGIAGLVAAIYPIASPGGYQLYGRTLPPWQTWAKGKDFKSSTPWLLRPFDQVRFKVISEAEYLKIEAQFQAGHYEFLVEPAIFSIKAYKEFVDSIQDEIAVFKQKQADSVAEQEQIENKLLAEWTQEHQAQLQSSNTMYSSSSEHNLAAKATILSSFTAVIWKLSQSPGYVIQSAEDIVMVLEAMKTEINVRAGTENIGHTILAYGSGVRLGAMVQPGQVLVAFG